MKMNSFKLFLQLFGLLLFVAACNNSQKPSSSKQHVVDFLADTTDDESFGGDVRLSVIKAEVGDTSTKYNLQAIYKGKPVGFAVEVPSITNKDEKGYGSGVKIFGIGKQSDDFRNALAGIYKLKADTTKKFTNEIEVAYVDLIQFSKSVAGDTKENSDYQKMLKLFFMTKEGEEAELFFNIDKTGKIVELNEKDQEYRSLLIKLLTDASK